MTTETVRDVVIIGSGPAGYTVGTGRAATYRVVGRCRSGPGSS
jgi:pyruvate/2-oxoglutarate dehydrogenase complex dihydrolipoamide dehydrogenase (E3) component